MRKSRRKRRARYNRNLLPFLSSSSSSPSLATTDDDKDRVGTKAGYGKFSVFECPDDRFAGVLDKRSYRLRNLHLTYGASQALEMGRTAKNMKLYFGGTPLTNCKEALTVFSSLRMFVTACDENEVSEGTGLYLIPNFLSGNAQRRLTRNQRFK